MNDVADCYMVEVNLWSGWKGHVLFHLVSRFANFPDSGAVVGWYVWVFVCVLFWIVVFWLQGKLLLLISFNPTQNSSSWPNVSCSPGNAGKKKLNVWRTTVKKVCNLLTWFSHGSRAIFAAEPLERVPFSTFQTLFSLNWKNEMGWRSRQNTEWA